MKKKSKNAESNCYRVNVDTNCFTICNTFCSTPYTNIHLYIHIHLTTNPVRTESTQRMNPKKKKAANQPTTLVTQSSDCS